MNDIEKNMSKNFELLYQDYENCQDIIVKGKIWELLVKEAKCRESLSSDL